MTASCQRSAANPDNGIDELPGLGAFRVRTAWGERAVSHRARYPRTRTAALARFLRGYLSYGSQNYAAAVEALDANSISATTSLGDYAFFIEQRAKQLTTLKGQHAATTKQST